MRSCRNEKWAFFFSPFPWQPSTSSRMCRLVSHCSHPCRVSKDDVTRQGSSTCMYNNGSRQLAPFACYRLIAITGRPPKWNRKVLCWADLEETGPADLSRWITFWRCRACRYNPSTSYITVSLLIHASFQATSTVKKTGQHMAVKKVNFFFRDKKNNWMKVVKVPAGQK